MPVSFKPSKVFARNTFSKIERRSHKNVFKSIETSAHIVNSKGNRRTSKEVILEPLLLNLSKYYLLQVVTRSTFTCSKSIMKTPEQCVKYVQR